MENRLSAFGTITGASRADQVSCPIFTMEPSLCSCHRLSSIPPRSDEEDDVICHHDLVVVLHAGQSRSDLRLAEAVLTALVDVVHQVLHLHRLSVSRLEDGEQRGLELLQPGGGNQQKLVF